MARHMFFSDPPAFFIHTPHTMCLTPLPDRFEVDKDEHSCGYKGEKDESNCYIV